MALVKVIISTVRHGSGYKHFGDEYDMPPELAKLSEQLGLVKILDEVPETKEFKQKVKTK